jgi:alpha-amylase
MTDICLYVQAHQPFRLRRFSLFSIGSGLDPFDDGLNQAIVERVAERCYLPANAILERAIVESGGAFNVALGISGSLVEQLQRYAPHALESFQRLVATGHVELVGETHAHSLAMLLDTNEFVDQVAQHRAMLRRTFDVSPQVFRGTELLFSDAHAPAIAELGFVGALVEGADHVLEGRSPNHTYVSEGDPRLALLPRNYRLSDDVGFRFSDRHWSEWPLTAGRYADWLSACEGDSVHLFLDYETFGEHHWAEGGILSFLDLFSGACLDRGLAFQGPTELARRPTAGSLAFPQPTSWADTERDESAWLGNGLQRAAAARLYGLRDPVRRSGSRDLQRAWSRLAASDHLYYMSTKQSADGEVHSYFSHFETPYDAYVTFMNVCQDLEQRTAAAGAHRLAVAA